MTYGAKGDGTTDDTAAISRGRDAAGVGGTLYFPIGVYIVDDLRASVASQTWQLSTGATLKLKDGTGDRVVTFDASGVRLTGGKVDGNKATQPSARTCLKVYGSSDTIEAVEVTNCGAWGIHISGADHTNVLRNFLHDTNDTAVFAENDLTKGANYSVIDANNIKRTGSGGIKVHGDGSTIASVGSSITNNYVEGTASIAIEVWGLAPNSYIAGNTTVGGTMGISVDRSNQTVVEKNKTSAGGSSGWNGLEIAGASDVTLRNNVVDGGHASGAQGVSISSGGARALVQGNSISRVKTGVHVSWGQANVNPQDGRIDANQFTDYEVYGVFLQGADRYAVTANVFTGGSAGSVCIGHERDTGTTMSGNVCN